jgi:subtilisin family serine protease
MALKFLDATGHGTWEHAAAAILYAADNGAKVVNNSYGCLGCFSQAVEDAIAYANSRGLLFVAAAMNDGNDNDLTPAYPCASSQPNILCVAATDRNDQLASFSNYGATTVDLGAPGVAILSTLAGPGIASYGYASGTSMAAPHVTGTAALLLAQDPALTVQQLKAILCRSRTRSPTRERAVRDRSPSAAPS